MLGRERALVTEVPGTTRDTIEADLDLDGWPVRLADTAGLRASEDRIERMGIEVSRRYLAAAELVVLCVEAGVELNEDEAKLAALPGTLVVRTKSDLHPSATGLAVSAETGAGLDRLARMLVDRLFGEVERFADLEPMVTRERHRISLESASVALAEARPEIADSGDAVLAAHHVRRAITSLDELIGLVDVEEVLGRIFERFCVGK
jgi:tRNA modification GTPase